MAKFTVRIPEQLHIDANVKKSRLRTSLQDVLVDLLAKWVGTTAQESLPAPAKALAARHETDLDLLRFVLEHGTRNEIEWIRGNLITFGEAIRGRQALKSEEQGLLDDFRTHSVEEQRRIRALAARHEEPPEPRLVHPRKPSAHRKTG